MLRIYFFTSKIMKIKILNKKIIFLSFIFLSVYAFLTPYISIISFKKSLDNKNYNDIDRYIDTYSLRKSIKPQLKQIIFSEINSSSNQFPEPFSNLKIFFINPILDSLLESTIRITLTPQGIKLLLSQGSISQNNINEEKNVTSNPPKINLYYKNLNKFVLSSKFSEPESLVITYWTRTNLFKWRLSSIKLPENLPLK